jgi:hypothetical protein
LEIKKQSFLRISNCLPNKQKAFNRAQNLGTRVLDDFQPSPRDHELATTHRFSLSWSSPAKGFNHMSQSRRQFLGSLTALGAMAPFSRAAHAFSATCPFHLSVINDEITPDFGRA